MSLLSDLYEKVVILIRRINQIEDNAKSNDELPTQSELVLSSKIRVSNGGESEIILVEDIILKAIEATQPYLNRFIETTGIESIGLGITINPNWVWMINGIRYTNLSETTFLNYYSATGFERIDIIVALENNDFQLIHGEEAEIGVDTPVAPTLPINALLVTTILVGDDTMDSPTLPESGYDFLISTDADNTIVLGADGKLYSAGGGGGSTPDATTTVKGKLKLAGDLAGTADAPTVPNKVDKISGKGLSTNDFTDSDKLTLDNLSNYTGFRTAQPTLAAVASAAGTGTLGDWAIITNPSGNAYFAIWDTDVNAWVEAGQSPTIPGTNLAYTVSGNTLTITSDTGNDVAIPLATDSATGLMSKEDKAKLNGIASGATNFTVANVLATLLTGLSLATGGAIVSTDSVLEAFGKIQKQINDILTTITGLELKAVARTTSVITFDAPAIYNSFTTPQTAQLSSDLTGARIGVVQVAYINRATWTNPAGWVNIGSKTFEASVVNIVYMKWSESTRVEYWFTKS